MEKDKTYKIIKVLNNNVILSEEQTTKQEMILVGKGIGFGKRTNAVVQISADQIQKSFRASNQKMKEEYIKLIDQLDKNVMGVSEEIIAKAETILGKLNLHIHIALTDHIGFALERIKMGMEIHNPFLYEIKTLYKEEFKMGKIAGDMIKKSIGIEISDSEVGFIALHFHSARQNKNIRETVKDTRLLKEAIDIIQTELNYTIDTNELTYTRLINHLRVAINRLEEQKCIKNPLLETIKKKFECSYSIAEKIGQHIKNNKQVPISEDEIGYMAIHIERLKEMTKLNIV